MSRTTASHKYTNRLVHETSPYLLQHAHNPVDWYPWCEEARERAKKEDRLILLSIGYAACHWCHVMEHESFEDEAIAALMNEHYVNIKVDREERPDLDDIYMAATLAMNHGQGGWPMTVFLTPDLEPVFAGTYFPPTDRFGRPGFATLLTSIATAWREDREKLRKSASQVVEHLRQQRSSGPVLAVGEAELRLALAQYAEDFDSTFGGFGSAPKFPPATALSLLLRLHRRFDDPHALVMVQKTLDAMAQGGMYDHIGGGFARYSTDRRWLVPHFEKMLYDNALLARTYVEAYQVTGNPFYRRIATATLDYILREMTSAEGGIYSSTDADSEGEEGKFFVWTPEQIAEVLEGREARRFNAYYDITPGGNWEGKSIPNTPRSLEVVAQELGITTEELQHSLDEARPKVYAARCQRVKPGLDDKVLTAWNGLMITALAHGYRVLGESRYLEAAQRAADFILTTLVREDGGLLRTYRAGKAHLNGYLEDYAYLSEGLIDLYEAGGAVEYLREAERLLERVLSDFVDEDSGAFYSTARDHEKLIMRYRDGADGATPSGNAVAASALARLSCHLDREDLRAAAIRAIKAYGRMIARHPRGFAQSLCVVDLLLEGPVELALVGKQGTADLEALRREVAQYYLPNRIQAIHDPTARDGATGLPLLEGKSLVNGKAALYVCRDFACQVPITDPAEVESALTRTTGSHGAATTIANHLPGYATAEATARYAARFASAGYTELGSTGLTTSHLGFGGYRVDDMVPEHRAALTRALSAGVNLVDTSANYADGASERLIGSVVQELTEGDELRRDEVIVVSKIGYVQGQNYTIARDREARGDPYPEMVKIQEGLWHCIHPEFLNDQLQRSLDRLELETLDICLLHNPEYFLSHAARRGEPLDQARDEFYRRLREAFAWFESEVSAGRLRWYGISSNTSTAPASGADATSLTRMLQAAREAGGAAHHCRVVQLPLNLIEAGAVVERNNGPDNSQTVLEVARAEGIAVLVNRPLNAFAGNALLRLADVGVEGTPIDFDAQVSQVAELESAFREAIAPEIRVATGATEPAHFFRWAEQLETLRPQIQSLAQWVEAEAQIYDTVGRVTAALERTLDGELASRWNTWREHYFAKLDRLMREMRRQAAEQSSSQSAVVGAAIDPLLPAERSKEALARKALWTVASTPGVTCVLNGMRMVEYVEDALAVMAWPKLDGVERVYRAAQRARISPL